MSITRTPPDPYRRTPRRPGLGLLLALLFGIVTGSILAAVFAYGVSLVVR